MKEFLKKIFKTIQNYVVFFLLIAFVISCCMLLFITQLRDNMGLVFTEENINTAAIVTFWNVVFLSFLCTLIDALRRKFTVERPVKQIVEAAEKIAKGDYSVRIPTLTHHLRADGLDEIAECFNKMAEELSGIETLQTDFIANVSHEMKTPLTVMHNYATLLQDETLSKEERAQYVEAISASSRKLADLITNILKLNKLENQQIYPASGVYELNEQLCQSLLGFERVWEEKNIDIETDLAEEVYINGDPELLSLVWNNLFSNALKFTNDGGCVTVKLYTEDNYACVEIRDTGCGISPEVGKRIFDKFYQGDTSRATQGNGLGLALVKRVVDIAGGRISVSSEPGVGSTFKVSIALAEKDI